MTALLTASHVAYEILRWAGVAYLPWMAARMVRDTFRGERPTIDPAEARAGADTFVGGWRQRTLTNCSTRRWASSASPSCPSSFRRARGTSRWGCC
ncbi:LysE family transporter [Streptomyces sp. NPDC002476]|uniref:LysE family transporter n=1 Tax=Streptomyces sp. NPDC002476 TaxID=3364648 RepID=UPI00368F4399